MGLQLRMANICLPYRVLFSILPTERKKPYRSQQMTWQRGMRICKAKLSKADAPLPAWDTKDSPTSRLGTLAANCKHCKSCCHFLSNPNHRKRASADCIVFVGYYVLFFPAIRRSILHSPCIFALSIATSSSKMKSAIRGDRWKMMMMMKMMHKKWNSISEIRQFLCINSANLLWKTEENKPVCLPTSI